MNLVPGPGENWKQLEFCHVDHNVEVISFTPCGARRYPEGMALYHQIVPQIIDEMHLDLIPPGESTPHIDTLWEFKAGWYLIIRCEGDYVASLRILPPKERGWTGIDYQLFHVIDDLGAEGDIEVFDMSDYRLYAAGKSAPTPRIEIGGLVMTKRFRHTHSLRDIFAEGVRQMVFTAVPEEGIVVARTAHGLRERLFRLWSGLDTSAIWHSSPFYGGISAAFLKGDASEFRRRVDLTVLQASDNAGI